MERSQSCSSFDATNCTHNNNNNKINNNNNNSHTTSHQLRKVMELRQTQLQHAGSSDNLITLGHAHLQHFTPMRKAKKLQRQQSTELLDDLDYAADLEEEAEEDFERSDVALLPFQKQLHFQQRKPQSTSSLILNRNTSCCSSSSYTTTTSSSSSSSCCCERRLKHDESVDLAPDMSPLSPRRHCGMLMRDNSVHSDSSRYSSVDSLLESRKPDPETVLINLGFGPIGSEDILSRIPKRFLKPSQVHGIDTEAFVKRLQLANTLADHSALGYRGLIGNPDLPPSSIVAKIMQRFEVNERKKSMGSVEHTIR